MMVGAVIRLALNDLRQVVKDRPSVFWMVIMPIGFIYLFGSFGMGGGGTPQVDLTVLDEDQSFFSGAFTAALAREGFAIDRMEAAAADTSATLVRSVAIPSGFADSLLHGHQAPIYYHVRPDADASFSMVAELHVIRAIAQLIADLVASAPEMTGEAELVCDAAFRERFATVSGQERQVTVVTHTAGRGRPVPRGTGHSLPATLTLFMLINTTIYGAVFLVVEKQEGILARMASFPLTRGSILAGKLLGGLLIALGEAVLLLIAGRFLIGAFLGHSLIGLALVVLCLALATSSLALFWGAVLRRSEQVTAITLVTALFLGAIGGCWWPLEVVPAWLRTVGHFSPAAWAMDGFHALISYGAGISAAIVPCLVLLGYGAFFFLIGSRLLRFTD